MKKADPSHEVTVLERNGPDDAFGWGVVFSAQTLEHFRSADAESYDAITRHFARWDDIDVHVKGRTITSGGHGFAGLARVTLLHLLQERARTLGVDLRFRQEVRDERALPALGLGDTDLVVAADGVRSALRERHAAAFKPDLDVRPARYIWLGTTRRFDAFNANGYSFEPPPGAVELARGPIPQAFRVNGSAWGVQFHPEIRRDQVLRWFEEDTTVTRPLGEIAAELDEKLAEWQDHGRRFLRAFLAQARP